MKNELMKRYNAALVSAVKANIRGDAKVANYYLNYSSGILSAAHVMADCLGTEVLDKMYRADVLACSIIVDEVEDVQESLRILENNMA